jgi:gamma-glutamylcyclotransferase (GGCT)/AIG2-like uncharacterized protein YtfP
VNLPFFVYGTLLPGQPNDHLWHDAIVDQREATMGGARIYDMGYYPMLVEAASGVVHGMLLEVRPEQYGTIKLDIDALEGYVPGAPGPQAFRRCAREIVVKGGEKVEAWVYVVDASFVAGSESIASGSWLQHLASVPRQLERWWRDVDSVAGHHELSP